MLQSRVWVTITVGALLMSSQSLTAGAADSPDDFTQRLAEVESWEKRIEKRQPPEAVLDAAGVRPGMTVGEVGAGRGRFTVHLSRRVGAEGRVIANDIDAEALEFLEERFRRAGATNVEAVLGTVEDPRFPSGDLDMIFMVWVFHMVESPVPLLESFSKSLKPGASVVMVEPPPDEIRRERQELAAEDGSHPLPTVLTPEHMESVADQAGFRLIETLDELLETDIIYVLERK